MTFGGGGATVAGGPDGEALLGRATTDRQKELAERAPALADAAWEEAADLPGPVAPPERDRSARTAPAPAAGAPCPHPIRRLANGPAR